MKNLYRKLYRKSVAFIAAGFLGLVLTAAFYFLGYLLVFPLISREIDPKIQQFSAFLLFLAAFFSLFMFTSGSVTENVKTGEESRQLKMMIRALLLTDD